MNLAWLNPIGKLVEGIGNYFTTRQTQKHELRLAKHNARIAKIERGDVTERDYDMQVLQNAASTVIDELMIMWVLGVVTCLFIPSLAPYAVAGFTALGAAPAWFTVVFVGCFISKLGLRFLFSGRTLLGNVIK